MINLYRIKQSRQLTYPQMEKMTKVSKATILRHINEPEKMHLKYQLLYKEVFGV